MHGKDVISHLPIAVISRPRFLLSLLSGSPGSSIQNRWALPAPSLPTYPRLERTRLFSVFPSQTMVTSIGPQWPTMATEHHLNMIPPTNLALYV